MAGSVVVDVFEAVGGPAISVTAGDGYVAGPTDAGTYVIAYCGRHSSKMYAHWSRIRWGSPLKDVGGVLYVQETAGRSGTRSSGRGVWVTLSSLTPVTREDVLDYHESLYGVRRIPSTWIFNDFGHSTCYMFRDLDHDGRLDRNERIHGEFFHTTPKDEADQARSLPVILTESHGCIHVTPADIDTMQARGYLKSGNTVHVHRYSESLVSLSRKTGRPPYEVHFYPGARRIVVKGRTP